MVIHRRCGYHAVRYLTSNFTSDTAASVAENQTAAYMAVATDVDGDAQLRIEDGVSVTLAATGSQSARSKIDPKTDPKTDPKIDPKTDTGIDPVAETRTDPGLDDLWADGIKRLDQPVHIDEDAILTPLSDPLSFGPLASGPLPGPSGNLKSRQSRRPSLPDRPIAARGAQSPSKAAA